MKRSSSAWVGPHVLERLKAEGRRSNPTDIRIGEPHVDAGRLLLPSASFRLCT